MATSDSKDKKELSFFILFLVLGLFFLSGACSLVYQVVWTRKLALLFGVTSHAVSTVLSVFFLGLGAGSFAGGRIADRSRHPLRLYGLFECIVGVSAVLVLLLLSVSESWIPTALRLFDFSRTTGVLLRAILSFLLLFIPVSLMGATLPLLTRFAVRAQEKTGFHVSILYAVNTFGAVAGCATAGFVLIASLGFSKTVYLAAALNIGAGLAAVLLSLLKEPLTQSAVPENDNATPGCGGRGGAGPMRLLIFATALCGFCGLAAEVVYTRLLSIVFLGTTYAFTTMLTAFLCGIGAGGGCAALIQRKMRKENALLLVGLISGGIAVAMLWSLPWIAGLPDRFLDLQRSTGLVWDATLRGTFFLAFLTLFPMTFLFGVAFPLVIGAGGLWRKSVGSLVGLMNGANTLGGVAGAMAGGFFLLPLLGSQNSITFLAVLLLVNGLALIVLGRTSGKSIRVSIASILLLCFFVTFLFLPADVNLALNKGYMPRDHEVLYMKEGTEGTVAVSGPVGAQHGEDRVLWINRVQATTSIERGVKMNRLQGVLPLLFDRTCERVLFMCFGSGITCGTLALSPFEQIDAVEISPEVLAVAPYFDKDNLGVLYNPAVSFHIDDGRNYLLRTDRKYDLITFEPMPLALAGVSTFYTEEYYRLCRKRLASGGIVSQWIPLHSNDPEMVRSLVFTFISAYPEYCAFFVNADLFLLGSDMPLRLNYAKAKERLKNSVLADALEKSGLGDLAEIMSCYLFDKQALDAYASGGVSMSDDLPWAEFTAPRLVYARLVPEAVDTLLPFISNPLEAVIPGSITAEERQRLERRCHSRRLDFPALKEYYGGSMFDDRAADGFAASLEADPENLNARYYLKTIVLAQGERFLQWDDWERVIALTGKALRFMPDDKDLTELYQAAEQKRDLSAGR